MRVKTHLCITGAQSKSWAFSLVQGDKGMHEFKWYQFSELSNKELYEILKIRQEVFVVEQNCAYLDLDDLDYYSEHLIARAHQDKNSFIAGYLRIIPPGKKYDQPSIGRVVTSNKARGTGLGKSLLKTAMQYVATTYPGSGVIIGAQAHLEKFYAQFGFVQSSEPYDEDGIRHIEMKASA